MALTPAQRLAVLSAHGYKCARCRRDLAATETLLTYYSNVVARHPFRGLATLDQFRQVLGLRPGVTHVVEINHIRARVDGGSDHIENLEPVCAGDCHRTHTAGVQKQQAKARRRRQKFMRTHA